VRPCLQVRSVRRVWLWTVTRPSPWRSCWCRPVISRMSAGLYGRVAGQSVGVFEGQIPTLAEVLTSGMRANERAITLGGEISGHQSRVFARGAPAIVATGDDKMGTGCRGAIRVGRVEAGEAVTSASFAMLLR